jgi:hypothetical protein
MGRSREARARAFAEQRRRRWIARLKFAILQTHPLRFGQPCARCRANPVTEWAGLFCGACLTGPLAEQRAATKGWPVVVVPPKARIPSTAIFVKAPTPQELVRAANTRPSKPRRQKISVRHPCKGCGKLIAASAYRCKCCWRGRPHWVAENRFDDSNALVEAEVNETLELRALVERLAGRGA